MLTATANSRPGSRLRLLTLLAAAHASLALYLCLCAFDVNLVIIHVRLWEVLTWSWVGWPVLLLVRYRRLVARPVDWAWGLVNGRGHHCGTPCRVTTFNRTRRQATSIWRASVAARPSTWCRSASASERQRYRMAAIGGFAVGPQLAERSHGTYGRIAAR